MNPWVKNPQAALEPGPFREGDRVSFQFGSAHVVGTIVEDRGNIGYRGRRLYDIRARMDDVSEDLAIEVPAEDLTLVERAPEAGKGRPNKRAVKRDS